MTRFSISWLVFRFRGSFFDLFTLLLFTSFLFPLEWLLILLSVLSVILLLVVALFLINIIKNRIRRRKYDKIKPKGKYVPGKTVAYFKGNYETNLSIIPKTYPAVLQTGNPLITQSWKVIPHSMTSPASVLRTTKVNDHRSLVSQYVTQTMDENLHRRSLKSRSTIEMKRIKSPLTMTRTEDNVSDKTSPSGSVGDFVKSDDYTKDVVEDEDQVYSHSELLAELDNTTQFEMADSAVISYDQDNYPVDKTLGPGSLFFILEYNTVIPELLITVKSGLDLPPVTGNPNTPLNSYVNLCLVPEDFLWQRTSTVKNDRDPIYNETFRIRDVLYHKLREYTVCFYVMDCSEIMGERVIGKVLYPLSDLRAEDKVEVCKELCPP